MKNQDTVQQFQFLRSALVSERETIQKRLQQIDAVLGGVEAAPAVVTKKLGRPPGKAVQVENTMTMREAIQQATATQPLRVSELVGAMQQLGYHFKSSNPANSVGAYLYGPGKQHFKKVDGKFSSIGGAKVASGTTVVAAKPAKKKNKMSAAGLANIRAAQKARWAKVKASAPAAPVDKVEAAQAVKPKRKISAASRKAMADAAKKAGKAKR